MKRILVSEAGGAPSINIIKSLRAMNEDIEIIGISSDVYLLQLADVDVRFLVPSANDPLFLPLLKEIIEATKPEVLLSQNDAVIEILSEHRDELDTKLFLPKHETITLCHNKFSSYNKWAESGLSVPKTFLITDEKSLHKAFKYCKEKVWLRATSGWSGRGALFTEDLPFAKAWITYYKGWGSFSAAEYLSPHSVTFMSIWNDGELVVAQSRKRIEWRFGHHSISGVTGQTGVGITVNDDMLTKTALAAIKAIDKYPHGIFSVDMTLDQHGIPNPTEINIGRFFATSYFFTAAGLNMTEIVLALLDNRTVNIPQRINPLPTNQVWVRQIDSEPVLTDTDTINQLEETLEEMRKQILKYKRK